MKPTTQRSETMITTTQRTARPFDACDWDMYTRAKPFMQSLQDPVIRYISDLRIAVASRKGVEISFSTSEEAEPSVYIMPIKFPSQPSAILFLNALPENITCNIAEELGFICIN